MRALSVIPNKPGSTLLDDSWPEPAPSNGNILVQTIAVGICGTDREIIEGKYGWAPPQSERLILGHESLGRILEAPRDSDLEEGDVVVGIVRHPDPAPCVNCAQGEWDMCRNGRFTEHGIKTLHGFCRERFRSEPEFLVKVPPSLGVLGVLVETASVLAKAWEHIDYIGRRAHGEPSKALILGAGPVGLLAALMAKQRGLEVDVFDKATEGAKPALTRELGAEYHVGSVKDACVGADVIIECTGVGELVYDAIKCSGPNGIVCLTGVSTGHRSLPINFSHLGARLVLENRVVFGTVNANRRHYEKAVIALAQAKRGWIEGLITQQVPLHEWMRAVNRRPTDIKNIIQLEQA